MEHCQNTRINEDIYDLLTLPYTFGSGVRARLLSARMPRNDEGSRYSLTTFITKGDVEAVLKTKLTVAGREAVISEYSGTVKMPRHGIELTFTQDDEFQDYLGNVESAILQMDEIANHRDVTVVINGATEVTPECVGMLCHMIANIEHNKLPDDPETRRLMMREKDVHYAVKSVNHDYEVRMESRPVDIPNSVAVDISMLSAKTTIGFTRYAPMTRPDTDKGCIEVHYKDHQPIVITDDKSRYERLTAIAGVVEHEMERLHEMVSSDLKELSDEQALEQ